VLVEIGRNLKADIKIDRSLVDTVVNVEEIHIRLLKKTVVKHVALCPFTRFSWM
jgi:hypothetical protein